MLESRFQELLDQWRTLPADRIGEILLGHVVVRDAPDPGPAARILKVLDGAPEVAEAWVILPRPVIRLGYELVMPDLAGWRMGRLGDVPENRPIAVTPDWVCETRTRVLDDPLKTKLGFYADQDVDFVWILDPPARTLEVLENDDGDWTFADSFAGTSSISAAPFPGAPLSLAAVWGIGSA